jgi:Fe-S cluster assembly protein SufD
MPIETLKMNLPKFLDNHPQLIYLDNNHTLNNAKIKIKDNHLTFKGENEFFVVINNYNQEKVIDLTVSKNQTLRVNLLIYNSKAINLNFNIYVEDNASLTLYTNFTSSRKTKLSISRNFFLKDNAYLRSLNAITYNGNLELNDNFFLVGLNAKLEVEQLNIGSKENVYKIKQQAFHQEKSTLSTINNNLITTDMAKMDYKVIGSIAKGKEFSKCSQNNKGIMLSNESEIAVEPTLFIDEYNVEANHGAAIGQIDELQLYYLLSRGLSETEAKGLIISGYTNPFINKVENVFLQKQLIQRISRLI